MSLISAIILLSLLPLNMNMTTLSLGWYVGPCHDWRIVQNRLPLTITYSTLPIVRSPPSSPFKRHALDCPSPACPSYPPLPSDPQPPLASSPPPSSHLTPAPLMLLVGIVVELLGRCFDGRKGRFCPGRGCLRVTDNICTCCRGVVRQLKTAM